MRLGPARGPRALDPAPWLLLIGTHAAPLHAAGSVIPRSLPAWQWLAIGALFAIALVFGWVLSRLTIALLTRVVAGTAARWDNLLLARIRGPLTLAWALACVAVLGFEIGLDRAAEQFVESLQRGGFFAVFFWTLARCVDVVAQSIARSPWALDNPSARSLVPLAGRVGKLFVLALAAIALFSVLGYPVASLLAGLGLGGLAFALAAQKTVENLFGAFSLGADQPFRVGDLVKVEEFVGTVESIGLRSTRIRTLDRTLITIPNGKLAEMLLESYAARDRMRLVCILRLRYGTSAAQIRRIVGEIEQILRAHPKVAQDAVGVALKELGESSLNVEVVAALQTIDGSEFERIRQDMLLRFMETVERAGSAFAFPTPVHLLGARADGAAAPEDGGTARAREIGPTPARADAPEPGQRRS